MSNTSTIPYVIKTNGSVTLYLKSECLTVAPDHPNYNKILDAIKTRKFNEIENLVNVGKAVTSYAMGRVRIENGQVFYGDFAVDNTLTTRILKMMGEGFKLDHMLKFLDNLMQNPSARAVDETYRFLENFGLPITDDGCFLAYKAVQNDYTDIYSGKFDNSVGKVVSMPRNRVDDNYGVDCSRGLHVGALDYVVGYGHFVKGNVPDKGGNRLLIVKVNPKNVVSVPQYDGHTKMRVCEYTVVSEIVDVVKELEKVVYTATAQEIAPDWDGLTESNVTCGCGDCGEGKEEEDADYELGYAIGKEDAENLLDYQFSMEADESDAFKDGYSDGFNKSKSLKWIS
jgi:hypothetical protein